MTSISAAPTTVPKGAADAAHEIGAADHGRGDYAQFVAGAKAGCHPREPADFEDCRDARHEAGEHIDGTDDATHRNAGESRRMAGLPPTAKT